jgi:hypothetical protein
VNLRNCATSSLARLWEKQKAISSGEMLYANSALDAESIMSTIVVTGVL